MNKADLRRQLKAARGAVSSRDARAAGRSASRIARHLRLFSHGQRIGFYLAQGGEFDATPLLALARAVGSHCYLPMLPQRGRVMRFGKVGRGTPTTRNRYGIPEPLDPRALRARELDLVLLPLVGFDLAGYRLGMGGGFYDATLAFMQRRSRGRKPRLIGLAYEAQRVGAVPRDPWDMPLDAVLTERRLHRFGTRRR